MKKVRIQWIPNLIRSEKRICLTRIRWERFGGPSTKVRTPKGFSRKISLSICYPKFKFIRDFSGYTLWIGLLRFRSLVSFGGVIP